MSLFKTALILCLLFNLTHGTNASCRDRRKWPFAPSSIWNMPIGSKASYHPVHIFSPEKPQPGTFFGDVDFFFSVTKDDPYVSWYVQGHWGQPCTEQSYCTITGHPRPGKIRFPSNVLIKSYCENSAAAILQEDNVTLLQMQPIYVCPKAGGPVLALDWALAINESILGNGISGAHGGSKLSSIGGTIRRGELTDNKTSIDNIRHALKLELDAITYYYRDPCFRWPATTCDGYHEKRYNGSDPTLVPGSLLAVPISKYSQLKAEVKTIPGQKILFALTYYGGYLVDDTYANRGTFCIENGVIEEFQNTWGYSFDARKGTGFYKDLVSIFRALNVVVNNAANAVGGGGTPSQPLAPEICGV